MAIVINGVVCQELVNGYTEGVNIQQGPFARKGFLCPWANRFQVAIGLLGLANTTGIGGVITLEFPAQHPELPTTFAHSVDIQGVGSPTEGTKQLQFPNAIIWCNYQTMPWTFQPFQQIDPSTPFVYAEQRLSSSLEYIQIPGAAATWSTTGFPLQQEFSYRTVLIDMQITIRNMPYMPSPASLTYGGTVNQATYLGVAAGQLMFMGIDTYSGAASDGSLQQEATYKFTARSIPWNYQYNPDPGSGGHKFDLVKFNGNPLIPLTDFTQIIPTTYG